MEYNSDMTLRAAFRHQVTDASSSLPKYETDKSDLQDRLSILTVVADTQTMLKKAISATTEQMRSEISKQKLGTVKKFLNTQDTDAFRTILDYLQK